MKDKKDLLYLKHILAAIKDIKSYLDGQSYQEFFHDNKTQDAIYRKFEIIGEAANKISKEFKKNHKETNWKDLSDMRNKLIHDYFGVDPEIVWSSIETDLPSLAKQIREYTKEEK